MVARQVIDIGVKLILTEGLYQVLLGRSLFRDIGIIGKGATGERFIGEGIIERTVRKVTPDRLEGLLVDPIFGSAEGGASFLQSPESTSDPSTGTQEVVRAELETFNQPDDSGLSRNQHRAKFHEGGWVLVEFFDSESAAIRRVDNWLNTNQARDADIIRVTTSDGIQYFALGV